MAQIVVADREIMSVLAARVQQGFCRFIRGREQYAALLFDQRARTSEKFFFSWARIPSMTYSMFRTK
jgi:hypothetical protein